jgi:DNA-binding MarR family transcriptional regulator
VTRKSEPARLRPDPPAPWREEMQRRYPDADLEARELVSLLITVGQELGDAFLSRYQELDLTAARFTVVMMIYRMEWESGAASPSELAKQANIGRASMTQLLDGLEDTGWIQRRAHPTDRRRTSITLKSPARRRLEKFLPGHYQRMSRLVAGISDRDRHTLARILTRIAAQTEQLD